MRQVDSLSKNSKNPPVVSENFWNVEEKPKPVPPTEPIRVKKSSLGTIGTTNNFYYFYKSLQVVMTVWIVTLTFMMVTPWADFFVKSKIKAKTSVLGSQNATQTDATSTNTEELNSLLTNSKDLPVFYLKNSKIEIQAPIVEGISEDSLTQGIGHHPDSVWPNEKGNVVIAGHNVDLDTENEYGKVFLKLRDVAVSDEVVVSFQGKQYHYRVYNRQTVKPDDATLFGPLDDWVLTFYTCDPPYTDWKRLVFQAKLESIE